MAQSRTADNNQAASEEVKTQIEALRKDVAALTHAMADYAKVQQASLTDTASEGVHTLQRKGMESVEAAAKKAGETYAQAEEVVRENPAGTIALAAGLGFLVGLITARR